MITPLNLIKKPTPIETLSGILLNTKIHIKRDDLTHLEASGNKIRKLEYLLADAKNKKSDVIITCGAIQSNHVRATMYCCAKLGLKGVVFLANRKQDAKGKNTVAYEGNLLLNYLFGADIHFLPIEQYAKKEEYVAQLIDDYKKKGHNPYFVPLGGSNGIGALGYVFAMEEMASYIKLQGIDSIFCTISSAGTYTGLLMGKYIFGIDIPLYGILVDESIEYFVLKIKEIIKESEEILGKRFNIIDSDIKLINGYIGPGYAIPYPEEITIIKQIAQRGIILDPVYTGKTFYGMLKEKERLAYTNPLFIHTGGIFSIFAYNKDLTTD